MDLYFPSTSKGLEGSHSLWAVTAPAQEGKCHTRGNPLYEIVIIFSRCTIGGVLLVNAPWHLRKKKLNEIIRYYQYLSVPEEMRGDFLLGTPIILTKHYMEGI